MKTQLLSVLTFLLSVACTDSKDTEKYSVKMYIDSTFIYRNVEAARLFNARFDKNTFLIEDSTENKYYFLWDSLERGPYTLELDIMFGELPTLNFELSSDTAFSFSLPNRISKCDSLSLVDLSAAKRIEIVKSVQGCFTSHYQSIIVKKEQGEKGLFIDVSSDTESGIYNNGFNKIDSVQYVDFLKDIYKMDSSLQNDKFSISTVRKSIYILADDKLHECIYNGSDGDSLFLHFKSKYLQK